jgi:excisionase family DNA binding protein
MADTVPKLLPLAAVAQALAVSPHTIRKMVRDGRLRPTKICRRLLFSTAELARFLADAK